MSFHPMQLWMQCSRVVILHLKIIYIELTIILNKEASTYPIFYNWNCKETLLLLILFQGSSIVFIILLSTWEYPYTYSITIHNSFSFWFLPHLSFQALYFERSEYIVCPDVKVAHVQVLSPMSSKLRQTEVSTSTLHCRRLLAFCLRLNL